jgi:hypothetical protein
MPLQKIGILPIRHSYFQSGWKHTEIVITTRTNNAITPPELVNLNITGNAMYRTISELKYQSIKHPPTPQ